MTFIRGAALLCYSDMVRERGGDPDALLRSAKVSPDDIGLTEAFIPFAGFVDAVEDAAVAIAMPDFGLKLAHRQGVEVFGALGAVATTAPTLGEGLALVRTFISVFTPSLEADLEVGPEESRFWFRTTQPGLRRHPQVLELLLGRTIGTVRHTTGPGFRPRAILVPHAPISEPAAYEKHFGVPVRFEQGHAGLLLATVDLDRSLDSDAEVHRVVQAYLKEQQLGTGDGLADIVRRIVERALPAGAPTLEEVADQVGLHPRTLQRHLADGGTTIAEIVESLRKELTTRYLRDTRLSLGQVANMLGYSQQSVLTRSCRRWFDATPTEIRKAPDAHA